MEMKSCLQFVLAGLLLLAIPALRAEEKAVGAKDDAAKSDATKNDSALHLIVMDPLAKPLSCPCVEGYAQRDYEQLAKLLSAELGREVKVAFNESLKVALARDTNGRADIVIGKHSVVVSDAQRAGLQLTPRLALTGKDGQTKMTGLFVVPSSDPATKIADLKNYRIIFGSEECDEKYSAAMTALQTHKVALPTGKAETCKACSEGATTILALGTEVRAATVISSYAAPLLEGCGTIQKGDLRMIGTTAPVRFIEAFVSQGLPTEQQGAIEAALLKVATRPDLLKALETKSGFVQIETQKKSQ
jgi:ABC-type phosphate/phosphonate transport system substrate-binding protein